MNFNASANSYYYKDRYNLLLVKEPGEGRGDCIKRTVLGYIAYKHEPFIKGVKGCFQKVNGYWKGYRHPVIKEWGHDDLSRDHVKYFLILLKYIGDTDMLQDFSRNVKWRISKKYCFNPPLWLWMKGLAGSKTWMLLYYLWDIPLTFLWIVWSLFILSVFGMRKEYSQKQYMANKPKLSLFDKLIIATTHRMYDVHSKVFAMYVSEKSFGRWLMQKVLTLYVPKTNLLLRKFLGYKVDITEYAAYKPMTRWRWSVRLNISDRDHSYTSETVNALDKDILAANHQS
jgi:hypothetical protein